MILTQDEAVEALKAGGIIAYPTEGVYGLGVDASNREAVFSLLKLKKRPVEKGLIVVVNDLDQVIQWIKKLDVDQKNRILQRNDEGFRATWTIPANEKAPDYLTGGRSEIAVRVTTHPELKELCRRFGSPIVSTSANISGEESLSTIDEIIGKFNGKINGVLGGALGGASKPSQIISLSTHTILRY